MNVKTLLFLIFLACFAAGIAVPRYVLTKGVTVTSPHHGPAIDAIYATGTVEPTIMVPIAPRSSAHLVQTLAEEGQTVKKGDVLARLEDTEQQATIANLNAQLAFAKSDLARKAQLYKTKSTSRDLYEEAKANVESLTAQVDQAKAQAAYLTLVAPADGLIIKKDGEIGELISAAQPIFYLSCCAPLRISAEVDEEDIPNVKLGQDVLIQSDAFPNQVYHGTIAAITPKGDPIARSYRVRITFDNTQAPLMIGMTTETNIITRKIDDTLLIPTVALGEKNDVLIAKNNQAKRVSVTTGIKGVTDTEITSGLSASDTIITPFDETLQDGQKIRRDKVMPAPSETKGAN
jgi:multidrug efflux system membrane fusion protein